MSPAEAARRAPDATRAALLEAAYTEIHRNGYQAASISEILGTTGLTKGALYHHFGSKQALGYAVVDEVIAPHHRALWIEPLADASLDPLDAIAGVLREASAQIDDDMLRHGCPLNNLAQEMSPIDEGFRLRVNRLIDEWRDAFANALARGQSAGQVRADVDPVDCALFIMAALEGCLGVAKNTQDRDALGRCGRALLGYLDSLRA